VGEGVISSFSLEEDISKEKLGSLIANGFHFTVFYFALAHIFTFFFPPPDINFLSMLLVFISMTR
jgi:hypothetical protein